MLALSHHPLIHLPPSLIHPPRLSLPSSTKRTRIQASSMATGPSPVMEFPYLSPAHRDLMLSLFTTIESTLGPGLFPSVVPPDVLSFQNQLGTSHGALDIRSGRPGSSVDFILESWIHCKLPMGALDITTLFAFLNISTDAPHLLMEFIQASPTTLILFVDLLPRKDLVLHPNYLDEFYVSSHLDTPRQELEKVSQVLPYRSSSLYIRSVLSPTAIAVNIDCGAEGQSTMEEMMGVQIGKAAKEIVQVWLDKCAGSVKELGEEERDELLRRDGLIKNKTVEIDLAANLPRLFGADVADRVVREIQKAFRIS